MARGPPAAYKTLLKTEFAGWFLNGPMLPAIGSNDLLKAPPPRRPPSRHQTPAPVSVQLSKPRKLRLGRGTRGRPLSSASLARVRCARPTSEACAGPDHPMRRKLRRQTASGTSPDGGRGLHSLGTSFAPPCVRDNRVARPPILQKAAERARRLYRSQWGHRKARKAVIG